MSDVIKSLMRVLSYTFHNEIDLEGEQVPI